MSIEWLDVEVRFPNVVVIYQLYDPIDGHVRYIGQTVNPDSRYRQHVRTIGTQCNPAKTRWVSMLQQQGLKPRMMILGAVRKEEAREIERFLIGEHARFGWLTNQDIPDDQEHRARAKRLGVVPYDWRIEG